MLSDKTKKDPVPLALSKSCINLIGFTFFPWVCTSQLSTLFPTTCHAHLAFVQTTLSTWIDFHLQKSCLDVKPEIKFPFPPQVTFKYSSPNWLLTSEKPQQITHFRNYSLTDSLLFPQLIFPLKAESCIYGLRQVLYLKSPTPQSPDCSD